MSAHRAFWFIAAASVAVAAGAFGLREIVNGRAQSPAALQRQERDRVVERMLAALELDPRVRNRDTQRLVDRAADFNADPALGTAETFYALGLREYYGQLDADGARDAFSRARGMNPAWSWPVNALAIVQFVSGDRDAALQNFERALRMEPGWSRPHADMAILFRRSGAMGEALRHAELALEIEPQHPINHYNYGVILDELGRHGDARGHYLAALDAAPGLAPAHYNVACSYARDGDVALAVGPLRRAIELEPAFIDDARTDPDFELVRHTEEFRALLGVAQDPPV